MVATVSSHILDTVSGKSAAGIRVVLYRISDSERIPVFDVTADQEGRILETVEIGPEDSQYELVFHGADYHAESPAVTVDRSVVREIVLRFSMPDHDGRYHIPIMLSPNSYSVWWAGHDL